MHQSPCCGRFAPIPKLTHHTHASQAKALAEAEDRHIKGLVAQVVEAQLRRLELKLKHVEELESMLENEHQKLEAQKQDLLRDRIKFQQQQLLRNSSA